MDPREQFTATAKYSNNTTANVTSSVTWTSSNTSVATICIGRSGHRARRGHDDNFSHAEQCGGKHHRNRDVERHREHHHVSR